MKRLILLVLVLPSLAALLLAQPAQDAPPRAELQELEATIQTELQSHGDRVLGAEVYRCSTRLEKVAACRVEFSVRVVSALGDTTVRTETLNFSLGALEPYSIALTKNHLELPCAGGEKCVFSTNTCSKTTKDGVVTGCGTASEKHVDTFSLPLDGDAAAASRLERTFRQAIILCHQPRSVVF
jgi:hypothetical protein